MKIKPLEKETNQIVRIPNWKETFKLVRKELVVILYQDILAVTLQEFSIIREMFLGRRSPLLLPSIEARFLVDQQQRAFTEGCGPLFVGYLAEANFL